MEKQKSFAVDYNNVKFYHPDCCPFGGFEKMKSISKPIDKYSKLIDTFFVVGQRPEVSNQLKIKKELVCLQMVINDKINIEIAEDIIKLATAHADSLYRLITLMQPGYFKKKTALLGDYFGIFKDG